MEREDLETRMRSMEFFHSLKIPRNMWKIIRVDGRSFSKLTQVYKHPFDLNFRDRMINAARTLFKDFDAIYAHTHSDEISIVMRPEWELFSNEVEKLVSTAASTATKGFNHNYKQFALGQFDARIWISASEHEVMDYFQWRQQDCLRNAINSHVYWHMRDSGMSAAAATSEMEGKGFDWKNEYLFKHGINFNHIARWQKRGIGFYWETYQKAAFNPKLKVEVLATRRRIQQNLILPDGDQYRGFVWEITSSGQPIFTTQRHPSVMPRPEMLLESNLMV